LPCRDFHVGDSLPLQSAGILDGERTCHTQFARYHGSAGRGLNRFNVAGPKGKRQRF
jgi:hypothetical protein